MSHARPHSEPQRPTEAARLALVHLPTELSLPAVFARACELAADAIGVERVGVWLYIDDRTALRCVNLYERSRNEHSPGAILRVADFPNYFAALSIRKSVPAEIASADPRTAELAAAYLNPLGITSMLDGGIFVGNELVGVVCLEHVGTPREWTTEARDFAGSVADLLALRYQNAELADLRGALRTKTERLAMIDKAEAIEHMAAGLTHDFRNLLTVVLGNGELLTRRDDLSSDARKLVDGLIGAAERGVGLANDMLDFANPTPRPPVVVNPADAVAGCLSVLHAAVGTRYRIRYTRPPAVGQILIDRSEFTRVLLNLAVNARDAQPDGGEVRIRVAPVRLTSGSEQPGHYVLLEVSDDGVGMDAETRKHAFDPYFTTKSKGTGIGLAVVRRVTDRTGGFVRIESAPGKGTTVRVFLPRVGASSGETTEFPALSE